MSPDDPENRGSERRAYRRFLAKISLALLLCFASIFLGMAISNGALLRSSLLERARSLFQEMVLARSWNAGYGGVYVRKGPGVESSPLLADPDLRAADGRLLTMRNPALMTREISAIAEKGVDFSLRISSRMPLNPANAPDDFERRSLELFETGAKEAWEMVGERGRESFRYMGVLRAEESCLGCHAVQGYKVGDVRGGISVTFPVAAIERVQRRNVVVIVVLGAAACAAMLAVLFGFFRRLQRELDRARAELREAAIQDGLTGLYNRRFALSRYEEELAKAKRTGSPLSVAIVDADNFKRVNDELGHLAGDTVLRGIASILREGIRPYDLAGRYGGEEFILLFPGGSRPEAYKACERIREQVEAGLPARVEALGRTVTVSVGIAALEPESDTASSLLGRADAALYRAKAAGKNRCEV